MLNISDGAAIVAQLTVEAPRGEACVGSGRGAIWRGFYGNRASRRISRVTPARYDFIGSSILRPRYRRDQKSIIGTGRESGGWG